MSKMVRAEGAIAAEIDGQIVALDIEQGVCFGLSTVASRIWQLIEQPKGVGEICDVLTGEYEVERGQCEAETRALLDDLRKVGLASQVD